LHIDYIISQKVSDVFEKLILVIKEISVEQDVYKGIVYDMNDNFDEPKLRSGVSESEYRSLEIVFDFPMKLNGPEVNAVSQQKNQGFKSLFSTERKAWILGGHLYEISYTIVVQDSSGSSQNNLNQLRRIRI
jgi:hypothetical protein